MPDYTVAREAREGGEEERWPIEMKWGDKRVQQQGATTTDLEGGMMRSVVSMSLFAFLAVCLVVGACYAETMEINIIVQPKTIVIASESEWLTVHTDIALSAVDTGSVMINDIPISWWKADARGNFVAKFDIDVIKASVTAPEAVFVLTGLTNAGVAFTGTDTVPVNDAEPGR